jgi:hypothetical protein
LGGAGDDDHRADARHLIGRDFLGAAVLAVGRERSSTASKSLSRSFLATSCQVLPDNAPSSAHSKLSDARLSIARTFTYALILPCLLSCASVLIPAARSICADFGPRFGSDSIRSVGTTSVLSVSVCLVARMCGTLSRVCAVVETSSQLRELLQRVGATAVVKLTHAKYRSKVSMRSAFGRCLAEGQTRRSERGNPLTPEFHFQISVHTALRRSRPAAPPSPRERVKL